MRKILLSFLILFFTFFNYAFAQVQEWQEISEFPGAGRSGAVSFVIDNIGYVGLGLNQTSANNTIYFNDFYRYDDINENWTKISDFPGSARSAAVAFTINGKAYVGTGYDANGSYADFYQYDPNTDNWQSVASIPNSRKSASSFVIEGKGYVGLGVGSSDELSDFHQYNPISDQWTEIADIGLEEKRAGAVGFASNGKGYITSGQKIDGFTSTVFSDLILYDPTTDSWTEQIFADINLGGLQQNSLYIDGDGLVHILKIPSRKEQVILDLSDYSTTTEASYFDDERRNSTVFYINDRPYAGLGSTTISGSNSYNSDFRGLFTFQLPAAPTIESTAYLFTAGKEYTTVRWKNEEEILIEGNIIYLSRNKDDCYEPIDTVSSSAVQYDISNEEFSFKNTSYNVKVVAYDGPVSSESSAINFFPIFRFEKINTPEILSIKLKNEEIFQEKQIEFINYDLTHSAILEQGSYFNGFVPIDTFQMATSGINTFTFEDDNTSNVDNYYRLKLYDQNNVRPSSDYSIRTYRFEFEGLKPFIFNFEMEEINYFQGSFSVNFSHRNTPNYRYIFLQTKNFSDSVFSTDTITYRPYLDRMDENDSVQARIILINEFGSDTSNIINIYTPLFTPERLIPKYSSEKAIGFSFDNRSNKNTGIMVERAVNGGSYETYDSLKSNQYEYFDTNVLGGNKYKYRLYNLGKSLDSEKSQSLEMSPNNMGAWKKFNGDGLENLLDSINEYSMQYKLFDEGDIYLLSSDQQKFFRFNLSNLELLPLADFPISEAYQFSEVMIDDGIIYCFNLTLDNGEKLNDIYRYNIETNQWDSSLELPFEGYTVEYAHSVNNKLFMIMRNENYKFSIGAFNKSTKQWKKSDYDLNGFKPGYVTNTNDSLIVFERYGLRVSYNISNQKINWQEGFYDKHSFFRKESMIQNESELIYFSDNAIINIDVNKKNSNFIKEALPVEQFGEGFAFVFDNKVFYGLSTSLFTRIDENGNKWKQTDLLYYRDENSPLEPAELKVDSSGINGGKVSWIDSPNEENYYIEFVLYDSVYVSDTLPKNQVEYIVDGLMQEFYYSVRLTALKGENISSTINTSLGTKRGRPYAPDNFNAKAISSSELLYTWDPIDTTNFPVNSLSIIEMDGSEYGISTALDLSDTSFVRKGLDENESPFVDLIVKNQYGSDGRRSNRNVKTFLNSPIIKKINIHEMAGFYEIVFEDKSRAEQHYFLYRKSATDSVFTKYDSMDTEEYTLTENDLKFEDSNASLDEEYEYYLMAYFKRKASENSDTVIYDINTSFPSETFSTENAILSVNSYLDANISVFPNPADQEVFIQVENHVIIKRIEVLNVNGSLVKGFKMNTSYNISDLKDGLYFIKIYTDQGDTTKKLIKR